jgi:hypothetical protein
MANSVGSLASVARNNKLSTCTVHKGEVCGCLETDISFVHTDESDKAPFHIESVL